MAKKIDEQQGVFQEIVDHMNAEEEKAKLRWEAARKKAWDAWEAHHAPLNAWLKERGLTFHLQHLEEFYKQHGEPPNPSPQPHDC